jgi:matrixin
MLKFINLFLILILATSCAPAAQTDCGYHKNSFGERISWKQKVPVVIYIHESVSVEFRDNIKQAVKIWNYKKKLFVVSDDIISGPPIRALDRKNVIYYITDHPVDDQPKTQAMTSNRSMGDQIIDSDMQINAYNFKFYSGMSGDPDEISMLSLVIHEMGHMLGLIHNEKDQTDVMFPYLANNLNRFELTESNKQSIECEY